jgi:uncharacterized protein DUF4440
MTMQQVNERLKLEILALEELRIQAMVRRDLAALNSLLADDLSYTHSGGRTDDKASFLALIESPETRYLGVDYSNTEVIPALEAVIVRGRAQIRLERDTGEKLSYPVLFLDIYTRRDGGWQMVAWQATRIPE